MKDIYKLLIEGTTSGKIDKQLAGRLIKMLQKEEKVNTDKDIAIIGMGARMPMAQDLEEYWGNIKNRVDCVRELPESRRKEADMALGCMGIERLLYYLDTENNKIEYAKSAYLDEINEFDYNFFRLSPGEASLMDPNQRLFLETAWETIEDAGYGGQRLVGTRTGVYIGFNFSLLNSYMRLISEVDPSSIAIATTGNIAPVIASRLSYLLNLRGPSMSIDTACSSSLVAVHLACQAIRNGECEMAIAGSSKLNVLPMESGQKLGIESSNGRTMSFDDDSDGTGSGEGVAAILLKPLSSALKDMDNIYAVIKGSAINQDGSSIGIAAPNPAAQEEVIVNSWNYAGVNPETITYIEAHGTGTRIGDPIEIQAIRRAFGKYTNKKQFCAIGTVKSNIGHLDCAAGMAGLIKAVMALKYKELPPNIHFDKPNKMIDFHKSPVYINDSLQHWETEHIPRRCGVSSFGMSGTNCHMVLEEFSGFHAEKHSGPYVPYVLTISAKTQSALKDLLYKYRKFFETHSNLELGDICYTANTGRGHYNYRLVFVVNTIEELKEKLDAAHDDISAEDGFYYGEHKRIVSKRSEQEEAGENEVTEEEIKKINSEAEKEIAGLMKVKSYDRPMLDTLCRLYVKGADVNWGIFYGNLYKKVSIPVYSFEKIKCWLDLQEFTGESNRLPVKIKRQVENKDVTVHGRRDGQYSELEVNIARIWAQLLGFRKISVFDNFLEIGGDSIFATRAANLVEKSLGIRLEITDILKNLTISELASFISSKYQDKNIANMFSTIASVGREGCYPVSSSQKRMFILSQMENIGTTYNIYQALRIEGKLDKTRLGEVLNSLVKRHETLRTSFDIIDGEIVQIVHEDVECRIQYKKPEDDKLDGIIYNFVKVFDLKKAPLLRVCLIEHDEDNSTLLFDIHHIISDGMSMGNLVRDFVDLYQGKDLTPLKVQYKDFSAWQNAYFKTDDLKRQEEYWLDIFRNPVSAVNIPADYTAPSEISFEGESVTYLAERNLMGLLKTISVDAKATLYMTLLSAYFILLGKYTGSEDMIIGTPIAGRRHADLEDIIGVFINMLALRNCPEGNKTFRKFLQEVKTNLMGAYENQDYQFEKLVEKLEVQRDSSRNPLFNVMFNMLNVDAAEFKIEGLKVTPYLPPNLTSKFDLTLITEERQGNIYFTLEYCTRLYKRETIERLYHDYIKVLDTIVKNPEIKIRDIELESRVLTLQKAEIDVDFEF